VPSGASQSNSVSVDVLAHAPPQHRRLEAEAGEELGELADVAELVRHVADPHGAAEASARARPVRRLRISASPETSHSSGSTCHGPTAIRPARASFSSRARAPGRTSR
jgi:hypothetical protein